MKIQPVSNNSNYSFNARFKESEVKNLIKDVKTSSLNLSELYTLLKFLDKKPINCLFFTEYKPINLKNNYSNPITYFLLTKDETIGQSSENRFKALYDACVKNNLIYKKYASLSEVDYKDLIQQNKDITEKEILKLSLEA